MTLPVGSGRNIGIVRIVTSTIPDAILISKSFESIVSICSRGDSWIISSFPHVHTIPALPPFALNVTAVVASFMYAYVAIGIRLIHEVSITGSIARQPLLMADKVYNCLFFFISNKFNGYIINLEYGI